MGEQTERLEKMLEEIDKDYYSHDHRKAMVKLEAEQALAMARIADTVEKLEALINWPKVLADVNKLAEL